MAPVLVKTRPYPTRIPASPANLLSVRSTMAFCKLSIIGT